MNTDKFHLTVLFHSIEMIRIGFGCCYLICIYVIFWSVNQKNVPKKSNCIMHLIYKVIVLWFVFAFFLIVFICFCENFCFFFLHVYSMAVIHDSIWNNRIHLAASMSRLRIKNSALSLMELLPPHLQDDKVAIATANPIVTGWVNPFKLK